MKKMYLRSTIIAVAAMFIFSLIGINGYSQIKKEKKNYTVEFNQTRNNEMNLTFTLGDYAITKKESSGVTYSYIKSEFGVQTMDKGYAELPMLSASVQLTPDKNVSMEVIYGTYEDINLDYPLLPSKGNLTRAVDPATIPYEIAPASIVDAWYPVNSATTDEPYIFRDVRGTNVYVYPMQYNAAKKILRVYNTITVKLTENNTTPINPLTYNKKVISEMFNMYKSVFINYNTRANWANEVGEVGDILIITTSTYEASMNDYIAWKKQMGYNVTLQTVTAGTNVKTTISTAYASNNKILYVLLVGDWADIKTPTVSITTSADPTDMMMGCVVGTDNYPDIIIGRFSVANATHVTTQANKAIAYEKTPESGGTWYKKALGIASDQGGPGQGDDGEIDYTHIGYIYTGRLQPFGFTSHTTAYDPNASASTVTTAVNSGVSVINYCGHGSQTSWGTTGFSSTNVNSLSNAAKLPFIFSVACINGAYHYSGDCFAEAWLRKLNGGAVAALMCTVNQDWQPPMKGQDYFADLIVGGHTYSGSQVGTNTDHGKTHFGSISLNGMILMYAEGGSSALNTLKTWAVFGDPSLQVRTDTPKDITLSTEVVYSGSNTYNVKVGGVNFKDALVSIWDGTNAPISGLTDASGNVTLNNTIAFGSSAKLTVTGYNLYTFTKDVTVTSHTALPTENSFSNSVIVSPNPASEQVKISIDNAINGTYNVEIMNLAGQVVLSKVFEKNSTYFTQEIDLSNLTKGAYLVKFSNNENTGFQKLLLN